MSITPEEQRERDIIDGFSDLMQQVENLKKEFDGFVDEHRLFSSEYPGINESVRQAYTLARVMLGADTNMKKARSGIVTKFIISWWHQHFEDDLDELEDPKIEEIKYTKMDTWEVIINYKKPQTEKGEPIPLDEQPHVREKFVIYSSTTGNADVYSSKEI